MIRGCRIARFPRDQAFQGKQIARWGGWAEHQRRKSRILNPVDAKGDIAKSVSWSKCKQRTQNEAVGERPLL